MKSLRHPYAVLMMKAVEYKHGYGYFHPCSPAGIHVYGWSCGLSRRADSDLS